MASTAQCLASMARLSLSFSRPTAISRIPKFLAPVAAVATPATVRYASGNSMKTRKRTPKKKKTYKTFRTYDLSPMEQMTLCDAMRVLRAVEVGNPPTSVKYDLAIKLKTSKNGPVIRSTLRLPFPFQTDTRIAVLCPDGPIATEARENGAVEAGQEGLIQNIQNGNIQFNKLICHVDCEPLLKTLHLGKILGPKGLMPNLKTKTITADIKGTMSDLVGAEEFRERAGVVRMAIGQLLFTPQMLADNIKVFMDKIKKDIGNLDDTAPKVIEEVVLSTTHGPGISLNGKFQPVADENLKVQDLEGAM
ncbi:Ribosomal protein L1-like protein [Rhypophila decipiens]